ncbi:hypothetical protein J4G63_18250 [Aeromonas sobria]|uniref:hypothetical protein n=1 Tax=Aeromonas sobria TaxID=646 RepID=UPI000A743F4D|nr:hypothetical protein [Aeromonas sobria]MBS4689179.1 hypothetical protein [Aeromonas sobria]
MHDFNHWLAIILRLRRSFYPDGGLLPIFRVKTGHKQQASRGNDSICPAKRRLT